METKEKKLYELAYFITPDLKDEEAISYADTIKGVVTANAGEVNKEEAPRKRRLAYPIKHKTQGFFGYLHFFAEPTGIAGINGKLALDKNVLRHLVIIVDKKQIAQMRRPHHSVAMQGTKKMDKEAIEQSIFKEGHQEEKKADLGELDKKLEEILNK